ARKGLASFLAGTGSGGAAEYLPSDVLAATYISTREPRRLFGEMTTLGARQGPSFPKALSEMEDNLGVRLSSDLAAALGTEYAFGVEGVSVSGSAWVFAALVNAPAALDDAIARMVQGVNAQSGGDGRLVLVQESIDGRIWNSLKSTTSPFTATWTYDRGYMVAASSRGGVLRAISARNGGASLIRSSEFQRQFSTSLGMHPAGFAWFDTHGAFAKVAELTDNPVLREALAEREPVLAVFTATPDAIRAASRVRMSGVIMNLMLMESANN
ncbi:MAG: hypothetical protein LBP68_02420, partial [Acidobacteriota bacterium]|nr:hypothetical protein [Acidobacteriota bacterium]